LSARVRKLRFSCCKARFGLRHARSVSSLMNDQREPFLFGMNRDRKKSASALLIVKIFHSARMDSDSIPNPTRRLNPNSILNCNDDHTLPSKPSENSTKVLKVLRSHWFFLSDDFICCSDEEGATENVQGWWQKRLLLRTKLAKCPLTALSAHQRKPPRFPDFDAALITWVCTVRERGLPVNWKLKRNPWSNSSPWWISYFLGTGPYVSDDAISWHPVVVRPAKLSTCLKRQLSFRRLRAAASTCRKICASIRTS